MRMLIWLDYGVVGFWGQRIVAIACRKLKSIAIHVHGNLYRSNPVVVCPFVQPDFEHLHTVADKAIHDNDPGFYILDVYLSHVTVTRERYVGAVRRRCA